MLPQTGTSGLEEERSALIHELCEALQAVTSYVQAAGQMIGTAGKESGKSLQDILGKAATQAERANRAFRRLRDHSF